MNVGDWTFEIVSAETPAVSHMWVDPAGFVRVGLNHLLPTAEDCLGLDWSILRCRFPPGRDLILASWEKVAKHRPRGRTSRHRSAAQAALTDVRLTDDGLRTSFCEDVRRQVRLCGPKFKDMSAVDQVKYLVSVVGK
jgi:hypothetical protein